MGGIGLEHSAVTVSKTAISESRGTESGTVDGGKGISEPDMTRQTSISDVLQAVKNCPALPDHIKKEIEKLIQPYLGTPESGSIS